MTMTHDDPKVLRAAKKVEKAWQETMKNARVYSKFVDDRTPYARGRARLEAFKSYAIGLIVEGEDTMRRHIKNLNSYPDNAFEWSRDAFRAAAEIKLAQFILGFISDSEKYSDEYNRASELNLATSIVDVITREIMQQARSADNHSTSASSNLINQSRLAANANFLDRTRWDY